MWQLMITLYGDSSMSERINKHIIERSDDFITIEEPKISVKVIKEKYI